MEIWIWLAVEAFGVVALAAVASEEVFEAEVSAVAAVLVAEISASASAEVSVE